jgi:hypothetical protein
MRPSQVLNHLDSLKEITHPFKGQITESRQVCWAYGAGCFFSSLYGEFNFSSCEILDIKFYLYCTDKVEKYLLSLLDYPITISELNLDQVVYAVKMFYRYSLAHAEVAENILKIGGKLENNPNYNHQDFGYVVKWAIELSEITGSSDQFIVNYVEKT